MTIVPCILTYLVYLGTVLTNIIKSQDKLCCMTTHKLKVLGFNLEPCDTDIITHYITVNQRYGI